MENTIGFYDSGVGGLNILKKTITQINDLNFIYVADNLNLPYGNKSDDFILNRSMEIVTFLIKEKASTIVLACNTATAVSIDFLRKKHKDINFIGIEPAVKTAFTKKKDNDVLLLVTDLTGKSYRLKKLINSFNFNENLKIIPCPHLVEAIEYNYSRNEILEILKKILCDFLHIKNLTIILGCTHYEFIKDEISLLLNNCEVLDGSLGVTKQIVKSFNATDFQKNIIKISKIYTTTKKMNFIDLYLKKLNLDTVDCSFIKI